MASRCRLLQGATLEAIVIEQSEPASEEPQNFGIEGGYDTSTTVKLSKSSVTRTAFRRIGEEKLDHKGEKKHPAG